MNWSKAKSIMIVILIAINGILLFCSQYTSENNSLSFESEKAIVKLLKQNGIGLYADLPKKFPPMPQLKLSYKESNMDELRAMFFGKEEEVKRSVELDTTILRKDNKVVTIDGAKIFFLNKENEGDIKGLEKTVAKKTADLFINSNFKSNYSNYKYFSSVIDSNRYCISYYETYKNYTIYSNYIKVYITNKGLYSVELCGYETLDFEGMNREICSVDEALLTFMYGVYDKSDKMNSFIDKVELGYIAEEMGQKATDASAIPCYMVSLKGNNKIYYINAYTNTIINGF